LPSEVIKYLSVDEALRIHERLAEEFGGQSGVRDLGLLETALFRPQTGCYEDSPIYQSTSGRTRSHQAANFAHRKLNYIQGWLFEILSNSILNIDYQGQASINSERAINDPAL